MTPVEYDRASWEYWKRALAGESLVIHEGEPQPGYYRLKNKAGHWSVIAVWEDHEAGDILVGQGQTTSGKTFEVDPVEKWTWFGGRPITQRYYKAFCKDGKFPDDVSASPGETTSDGGGTVMGHNKPPEDGGLEEINVEVDRLKLLAEKLTAEPIADQLTADKVANCRDELNKLSKRADELRKAEALPFDEGKKAVQSKWLPTVKGAKEAADACRRPLGAYMAEEERKAKAEAARLAEEQAKAAKAMEDAGVDPEVIAAQTSAAPVETKARVGGSVGKRASLRTITTAEVKDWDKAIAYFHEDDDLRALVQKLANRLVAAGGKVPGCVKHEEKEAV